MIEELLDETYSACVRSNGSTTNSFAGGTIDLSIGPNVPPLDVIKYNNEVLKLLTGRTEAQRTEQHLNSLDSLCFRIDNHSFILNYHPPYGILHVYDPILFQKEPVTSEA